MALEALLGGVAGVVQLATLAGVVVTQPFVETVRFLEPGVAPQHDAVGAPLPCHLLDLTDEPPPEPATAGGIVRDMGAPSLPVDGAVVATEIMANERRTIQSARPPATLGPEETPPMSRRSSFPTPPPAFGRAPRLGIQGPLVALLALLAVACGAGSEQREAASEPAQAATDVDPATRARAEAVLARADAADGTVDPVVEKCSGCNLHMSGKPEQTVAVLGYELHQCSATCKERFEKAPVESVLAMRIDD